MGYKSTKFVKRFEKRLINMWGMTSTQVKDMQLYAERTGADDPMWRRKVASGVNATNYLYAYRKWAEFRPSKLHTGFTESSGYSHLTVYDETHHPFPEDVINNVNADALKKASNDAVMGIRNKIRKETETFKGLPFLGELREAAHMLRNPAEALAKGVNEHLEKAAKKRKRSRKGAANVSADMWLEAAFGWAPLINDIQGIAEATLRRYEDSGIKRVSGSGKESWAYASVDSGGSNNYHQYYYDRHVIGTVDVNYTAGVNTNITRSNNALERVIENGAFEWREVIPAAWELVPWSFLVDYFGNIGDVLNAATQSLTNVTWVAKRVRTTQEVRCSGLPFSKSLSSSVTTVSADPGFSRSTLSIIERSAAEIPIPELRFELPGRKSQLLNIAALLGSRLRF